MYHVVPSSPTGDSLLVPDISVQPPAAEHGPAGTFPAHGLRRVFQLRQTRSLPALNGTESGLVSATGPSQPLSSASPLLQRQPSLLTSVSSPAVYPPLFPEWAERNIDLRPSVPPHDEQVPLVIPTTCQPLWDVLTTNLERRHQIQTLYVNAWSNRLPPDTSIVSIAMMVIWRLRFLQSEGWHNFGQLHWRDQRCVRGLIQRLGQFLDKQIPTFRRCEYIEACHQKQKALPSELSQVPGEQALNPLQSARLKDITRHPDNLADRYSLELATELLHLLCTDLIQCSRYPLAPEQKTLLGVLHNYCDTQCEALRDLYEFQNALFGLPEREAQQPI